MTRIRTRSELGKGVEALRSGSVTLMDNLAGSVTYYGIIGPFETDIDVKEVVITAGLKPATNASNTLDVFNGTAAGSTELIAQLDNTALQALTDNVPASQTVIATAARVAAGTAITVKLVAAASNAAAPASVTVRIGYDIPTYDPTAKIHTYGSYDGGE